MHAFPAYLPLAGRRVAIAGGGEAADAKARLFEGSPAEVIRLDAEAAGHPEAWAGAVLAFVAIADEAEAAAGAAAARAAGALVNVVDRPALCDFTTPAVIDRGELVVAIGTGGSAPILASLLRADLEARIPPGAGRVAALLGRLQPEVRRAFPDLARRRAFLRGVLSGPAAEAALAGDEVRAEILLRQAIAAGEGARGALRLVDGAGPADLLTLRAARALAEVDLLVVDPDAASDILVLARRDAARMQAGRMPATALDEALAAGRQVVWVTGPNGAETVRRTLAADGVVAEVLPRGS